MYDQIKLSETVNDLCDAQINPVNNLNHLNQEDVMVIWFLNKSDGFYNIHTSIFSNRLPTLEQGGIPGRGPISLAWISNYTHYNAWDEITYPFQNFNNVWDWRSNFIPHFTGHEIIYPCWN